MADIKLAIAIDAPPENAYPLVATSSGLMQGWALGPLLFKAALAY